MLPPKVATIHIHTHTHTHPHTHTQVRFGWPLGGFERCWGAECRATQERRMTQWSEEQVMPLLFALEKEGAVDVQLEE